jgi:hypothetical protein
MREYEVGVKKAGRFKLAADKVVWGELCLNGGATRLDLFSEEFFTTRDTGDVFGTFHDRSKASLLQCITTQGPGHGHRGDEQYHFSSVFPHFVVYGNSHISSADQQIATVSFSVDDAPVIFYDYKAFGSIHKNARTHLERILEEDKADGKIELGEHPDIYYFTGKQTICTAETVLGKITVFHGISLTSPGPKGIRVDNTIFITIDFPSLKTVSEAIRALIDVLRFLEIIAGRPQNIANLRLFRPGGDHPEAMDVYWCLPPHRDRDAESEAPHPMDLPIRAAEPSDGFAQVLTRWLERNEAWRNARSRFSTALSYQNRYDVDRIIGAANVFDIMPEDAYPPAEPLPADLMQARDVARSMFAPLPVSPERDSVLGALGRLGTPTLKRKIRSRIKLVTDQVANRFPDLELVADCAVDCRNYFVHGSMARMDYGEHVDLVHFFTDTLEFIFATSDLVQCGWDIRDWTRRLTGLSHPFARYRVNYEARLTQLRKAL